MAATTSSSRMFENLVQQVATDYHQFRFKAGRQTHWSPRTKTITYNVKEDETALYYGLFHELAHGLLGHNNYTTDFELLRLESDAWGLAAQIAKKYNVIIDDEHIQNCLDTYRDWLHRRSTCPACGLHVMQRDGKSYQCHNCQTVWQVTTSRFVRPYRKTVKHTKTA